MDWKDEQLRCLLPEHHMKIDTCLKLSDLRVHGITATVINNQQRHLAVQQVATSRDYIT